MDSVLIIDDNIKFLQGLIYTLKFAGFKILIAENGSEGVDLARRLHPDIILCDIVMDGLDGFGVAKILKLDPVTKSIPIVFLSGKTENEDIKQGFLLGVDDYIKKPCVLTEVVYRIKAILRRTKKVDIGIKTYGQLWFNPETRTAFIEGREVRLSPTEALILNELITAPNTLVSSEQLVRAALGKDETESSDRAIISVHIYNLRHKRLKLESTRATYIVTEGHQGYRLFSEETGLELMPEHMLYTQEAPQNGENS